MDLLVKWWKHNPEYIAILLIALVASSTLWYIFGKDEPNDECSWAFDNWMAEVADQRKFLSMNRPDRRTAMSQWPQRVPYEDRLLSIRDAGRAAVEIQDECGHVSDDEMRTYFHSPTMPPADEQRECFEYRPNNNGRKFNRAPEIMPGCEEVLWKSVPWIKQNFP